MTQHKRKEVYFLSYIMEYIEARDFSSSRFGSLESIWTFSCIPLASPQPLEGHRTK